MRRALLVYGADATLTMRQLAKWTGLGGPGPQVPLHWFGGAARTCGGAPTTSRQLEMPAGISYRASAMHTTE
jgi:hypothetical protein